MEDELETNKTLSVGHSIPNDRSVEDDALLKPPAKRRIKLTSKGLSFFIQTCQEKRSAKIKQAKKCLESLRGLMKSNDNAKSVKAQLCQFINCYGEAMKIHHTLLDADLPEEEVLRQNAYVNAVMTKFLHFTEDVKVWLSEAGYPYVENKVEDVVHDDDDDEMNNNEVDNENVDVDVDENDDGETQTRHSSGIDDINPEDSASNILCTKGKPSKAPSNMSKTSSTASARIKAEADKAALMERLNALKRKHELEAQEEKLRKEKEQFALETELNAANARINAFEVNSKCGSKRSNGMNSYLERSKAQGRSQLNPRANLFVPQGNVKDNMQNECHVAQVVRPKTTSQTTRVNEMSQTVRPKQTAVLRKDLKPLYTHPPRQGAQQTTKASSVNMVYNNNQNDILNIMQRQTDITALLVQQNLASALPVRKIPIFDGDPLMYHSFIRSFESCVEMKTDNVSDCLHFLEQYTSGQPRDLVKSCQYLPPVQGYQRAKSLLAEHFGDEFKIASACMTKIDSWPPIKAEDVKALQSFSLFLKECSNLTQQITHMNELDMPSNLRNVIMKLPYKLREKWRTKACDLQEQHGCRVRFIDLVNFVEKEVRIASDPLFGNIQDSKLTSSNNKSPTVSQPRHRKQGSFATNVTEVKNGNKNVNPKSQSYSKSCLFCQQTNHALDKCSQFKLKTQKDKICFIKENGICFGCLKVGHTSKDCRSRLDCSVCQQRHPSVLHIEKGIGIPFKAAQSVSPPSVTSTQSQTCGHIGAGDEDNAVFSIVAVQVKSQLSDRIVQTYAFLDPGSSGTFCTQSLAKKLGLSGKPTSILLRTMGQKKVVNTNVLSHLEVSGMETDDFIELPNVLTQKAMPVSRVNIPRQEDVEKWAYLRNIKLHNLDADVDLLIGTDAAKVMEPWELINSQDDGPYAVRTRVGWVINGPLRSGNDSRVKTGCSVVISNRISVEHLEEMLIKQYNHDFNEKTPERQLEMSREDIKFMKIMRSSTELKNGHYYLDLPFREEDPVLPNNRCVAEQRLKGLKRKFEKDAKFKEEYTSFINDMLVQGYAEVVPTEQLEQEEGKVWYIPHHGVHHPTKGKLRVVYDCGASYKGTSLNCQLLQGPNLTNTLMGVLIRFRKEPVAVMADIQAMFHQVRVPDKHVNFLRFLWWPQGNTDQEPAEYRMRVHLFGAVSSPSCANYALRRTAEDFAAHFPPEVIETVNCNFYVDDCLKSTASEGDAIKLVKDLTLLCSKGGFNLQKWVTTSRAVLTSIPGEIRATAMKELDLDTDHLPMDWSAVCVSKPKPAFLERPVTKICLLVEATE